jgi:TonB family protein
MKGVTVFLTLLIIASADVMLAKRYSDAELAAMFVSQEKPYYPVELRRRGITGSGMFRLYIDEQGRVTRIGILRSTGNTELDALAMRAMVHWRARPGPKREVDQPCTFWFRH